MEEKENGKLGFLCVSVCVSERERKEKEPFVLVLVFVKRGGWFRIVRPVERC